VLDAQIKNLNRSGKENVSHKPAIEEEDLQNLKSSEVLSLLSLLSFGYVSSCFSAEGALKGKASSLKPMRLEEITQP